MQTITLKIDDNIFEHVMFLLDSLKKQGVEIIKDDSTEYELWSEEELKNIGKIAFNSKSFEDDDEM